MGKLHASFGEVTLCGPNCTDTGNAPPIRLHPRCLPLAKRGAAKAKLKEMLAVGVIEPSEIPWLFPLELVRKKDNSWRFCVDYQRLNYV